MPHQIAQRVAHFKTTIFAEMTALATQHNAINLGQGFPDFPAPGFIKEAAADAIAADINQYPPAAGRPRLRQAIADTLKKLYGLTFDPATEITATHGATEALFAGILGLVNPGDEVILFEPTYDSYLPAVEFAGGIPRFYTLRPPDWRLDSDQLAALFNDKTRLILLNTPHNPTGKVFSREEMQTVADLCVKYDVIALSDEVYEHILFDDLPHIPLATLPGMAERTLTIGSAGKSFSVTGWKVGWAAGPAKLVKGLFRVRQFSTFAGAAPFEEAAAIALERAPTLGYYEELRQMYEKKRDYLVGALQTAGIPPLTPQGTYFIMADISQLGFADDVAFCRHLTTEVGVAAIPPSAFYQNPADGATVARFAFCKSDPALAIAADRLANVRL